MTSFEKARLPRERREFVTVLPTVAVSAWVSSYAAWRFGAPLVALLVALAALACALLLRRARRVAFLALFVGLGIVTAGPVALLAQAAAHPPFLSALASRQATVQVVVVVSGDPHLSAASRQSLAVVPAQLVEVTTDTARTLSVPVVVLADDTKAWLPLLPGQRVHAVGRLAPTDSRDAQGALVLVRGSPELIGAPPWQQRLAGRIRAGLRNATSGLPTAERGLLPGVVVGDTSALDPQLQNDFRTVGLTHLVAVSGANLAIVLAALLALVSCVGAGRRTRAVVIALGILAFVVIARPSPSVLRAAVMGSVALIALVSGRPRAALGALAASAYLLLLFVPQMSTSAGFALSVLATGAIVLVAPRWRDAWSGRLPRRIAETLAVATAAQLACAPLLAALFGQFSVASVVANAVAEPVVPLATVAGALAAVASLVSHPLAVALAWVAWLPVRWLVVVATTGARVPLAAISWPSGLLGGALCLGAIVGGRQAVQTRRRRFVAGAVVLGVVAAGTLVTVLRPWPPAGWVLAACDIGQGDAFVLHAADDSTVVVDTGPDPALLASCLHGLGVRTIAAVVLTHMHIDHVGGLLGALAQWDVGAVLVSGYGDETTLARVRAGATAHGTPVTSVMPGEHLDVGALSLTVLSPVHAFTGTDSDEDNDSIVLRGVVDGKFTALMTGDVRPAAQQELLVSGVDLHADVFKIPHHGSADQDNNFLRASRARFAVASMGAGNRYGHPSPLTMATLQSVGIRTFRTDRDGAVAFAGSGDALTAVGRRGVGSVGVDADVPPAAGPPAWGLAADPQCTVVHPFVDAPAQAPPSLAVLVRVPIPLTSAARGPPDARSKHRDRRISHSRCGALGGPPVSGRRASRPRQFR